MNQRSGAPVNRDPDGGLTRIDPIGDQPVLALNSRSTALPPTDTLVTQSMCGICDGAGWVKEAVSFGHPHFGLLFPCQCKRAEWAQRTAEELARLSNLEAIQDKTFATFNPFIPGLRDLLPRIRAYARRPDGWLTLLGPYGVGKPQPSHYLLRCERFLLYIVTWFVVSRDTPVMPPRTTRWQLPASARP